MRIRYFQETDTSHLEFKFDQAAETRDLDENTLLDVDKGGNILGLTMEQASRRADIPRFFFEQAPA